MKRIERLGVAFIAAGLLAACDGGSTAEREAKIEREAAKYGVDADVTLDDDGEVKSVTLKNGATTVGSDIALPDGFPKDIPIPASWNVMMTAPVGEGYSLQALSDDSADGIVAAVRSGMEANGWTEKEGRQAAAMMRQLGFEKNDRLATFNVIPNGAGHAVQMATMKKPN
ncbi:MAG: hypothetical protein AAF224_03010 [Pseudomonadota bacterium]